MLILQCHKHLFRTMGPSYILILSINAETTEHFLQVCVCRTDLGLLLCCVETLLLVSLYFFRNIEVWPKVPPAAPPGLGVLEMT